MGWTMTRVFPEPGPATMRSGPCVACTASRCAGLSPSSARNSPPGRRGSTVAGRGTPARDYTTRPAALSAPRCDDTAVPRRATEPSTRADGPVLRFDDLLALIGPEPRDGVLGERRVEHMVKVRRLL